MKAIKLLLVLFTLSALAVYGQQASSKKAVKKNIGLQLYSLRDDFNKDFNSTIAAAGKAGYKYAEAASYANGKFYGLDPKEYKAKVEAAGMVSLSTHTNRVVDVNELQSANWDEVYKWWDTAIDAAKAAGMKYVVMPSMPRDFNKLSDLQIYCDYMNKIGEKCNAKGLRFGYHNHNFEFKKVEDKLMYDYMLEHTNPALVFFQMDVYWAVRGQQSPVEYFERYPGRFEMLHIKDHKELGESGMVGFDAIFKHIQKAGTKYLIVEVEKYNYPPLESVQKSLDYLLNAPYVKADYSK
ncbi:MAG: sugar phosphate isomerase/epimerase [Dysgonamonadaceae bacterium]|jgi:sugar phosphate isomerase/epimerase|nr:sugar phosphate isomerase/epimerase [Dysgonamonadaceae bacterium]